MKQIKLLNQLHVALLCVAKVEKRLKSFNYIDYKGQFSVLFLTLFMPNKIAQNPSLIVL